MDSFVYCWTDTRTNKLYVGVHKGTLTDGYICSSKYMLEEYNKRPNDFVRQILAFGIYKEMLKFEYILLKSANAAKNPNFYNKHNGDGRPYTIKHTEETKQKMSKPKTEEHKKKLRGKRPHVNQSGTNNNAYKALKGVPKTDLQKVKNSLGQSKIIWTIISPNGDIFMFKNLRQSCKAYNIPVSPMTLWHKSNKINENNEFNDDWICLKNRTRFKESI